MRTDLNKKDGWILTLRGYTGPLTLKCKKAENMITL